MFSRVSATFLYTVFALTVLAAATPNVPNKRWGTPTTTVKPPVTTTITVTAPATTVTESAGNCNTGSLQCCQSTEDASSAAGTALLGLLGVVLTDLNILLGLDCSPLTVIGVGGGSSCSASPVCCENNNVGGLISIGCIPVIL